jgi:hypothetical protein
MTRSAFCISTGHARWAAPRSSGVTATRCYRQAQLPIRPVDWSAGPSWSRVCLCRDGRSPAQRDRCISIAGATQHPQKHCRATESSAAARPRPAMGGSPAKSQRSLRVPQWRQWRPPLPALPLTGSAPARCSSADGIVAAQPHPHVVAHFGGARSSRCSGIRTRRNPLPPTGSPRAVII